MASAKATTRKLTGRAKKDFFNAGLTPEEQDAAVTSLQVRKDAWPVSKDLRRGRRKGDQPAAGPGQSEDSHAAPLSASRPAKKPAPTANRQPLPPSAPETTPQTLDQGFDPFVFGLVPIFKREGAEGLAARLQEIADVDNLRAMAKAQQIVLPRDVRRGEAGIETVRSAVLSAVEQRITDRKAQL